MTYVIRKRSVEDIHTAVSIIIIIINLGTRGVLK